MTNKKLRKKTIKILLLKFQPQKNSLLKQDQKDYWKFEMEYHFQQILINDSCLATDYLVFVAASADTKYIQQSLKFPLVFHAGTLKRLSSL